MEGCAATEKEDREGRRQEPSVRVGVIAFIRCFNVFKLKGLTQLVHIYEAELRLLAYSSPETFLVVGALKFLSDSYFKIRN